MRKAAKWITALLLMSSGASIVILTVLSHAGAFEIVLAIIIGLIALGIGSHILTEDEL